MGDSKIREASENGKDYLFLENDNKLPFYGESLRNRVEAHNEVEQNRKNVDDLNDSVQELRIPFSELKRLDPERAKVISDSVQSGNGFSDLDKKISGIDYIEIAKGPLNTGTFMNTDITLAGNVESTLLLSTEGYKHIADSGVRASVEHEVGHAIIRNTNSDEQQFSDKASEKAASRKEELTADRYADASGTLDSFLSSTQTNRGVMYDFDGESHSHPNDRVRVGEVLAKMYGNDVFKNAGTFDDSGKFQPKRDQNGTPVSEDGQRITNWDADIEPAIRKQVADDMEKLDGMVDATGMKEQGITDADKAEFKQHVSDSVKEFRQKEEHQPQYEKTGSSNKKYDVENTSQAPTAVEDRYQKLANSFRDDDHRNLEIIQKNIDKEPEMGSAYAALHLASEQIKDSGLHPEAQQASIAMVKESLASKIEKNEYPNIQRQEAAQSTADKSNDRQLTMNR